MKRIVIYCCLWSLLLTQCQHPEPTAQTNNAIAATDEPVPPSQQLAVEQMKLAKIVTPQMSTLAGKWQATDDSKSMVEIKGTQFIEYYERTEKGNAPFAFYNKCKSQGGVIDTTSTDFIVVTDNDTLSRCYYVELAGDNLKLTHAEAGTEVSFKRVE